MELKEFHHEEKLRASIAADKFCNACSAFLSIPDWQQTEKVLSLDSPKTFHSSFSSLQQASVAGCHLCAVLEGKIRTTSFHPSTISVWSGVPRPLLEDGRRKLRESSLIFLGVFKNARLTSLTLWTALDNERNQDLSWIGDLTLESKDKIDASVFENIESQRSFLRGSTSTQDVLKRILRWMDVCDKTHELCKPSWSGRSPHPLPTRLLDLRRLKTDALVALVDSHSLDSGSRYATLSHRWGEKSIITLNKQTETPLSSGIAVSRLPVLFRDVCQVVRELGVSYLWIDSLCIEQDSKDDWEHEAGLMTSVYLHSFLNIVAGHATHEDSLFSLRNPLALTPCIIKGTPLSESTNAFAVRDPGHVRTEGFLQAMPTQSRGWILQECLLAPRVVFFGKGQVFWRCSFETDTEESDCGFQVPGKKHGDHDLTKEALAQLGTKSDTFWSVEILSIWRGIVEEFTKRNLTKEEDRLVALAGIAELLQIRAQDRLGRYFAGVWERGFERQLCWGSQSFIIRCPSAYLAPSWSWASHLGAIRQGWIERNRPWCSFLEGLQIVVTPVRSAFGKVRQGYFLATANLCRARVDLRMEAHLLKPLPRILVDTENSEERSNFEEIDATYHFEVSHPTELQDLSLLLMPLLHVGELKRSNVDSSDPTSRGIFTDWQLDPILKRDSAPLPKKSPNSEEDWIIRGSIFALILIKVGDERGVFSRLGYMWISTRNSALKLKQTCLDAKLSYDMYLEHFEARRAYRIKVV